MQIRVFIAALVSLATVLMASAADASAYSNAVLASNPVVYYRLGEMSGTVAANSSAHGSALDAIYVNFGATQTAPALPSTLGELGPQPGNVTGTTTIKGFESDNIAIHSKNNANAQVQLADNPLLDITGALTLEAWIYRVAQVNNSNNDGIVSKFIGDGVNQRSYNLYYDPTPGRLGFILSDTGNAVSSYELISPSNLPLGQWVHVAATYVPGTRVALFVNGAMVAERLTTNVPTEIFNSTSPLWIGRQYGQFSSTSFEGRIDEVAVYGTALSDATILTHYKAATMNPGDFDQDGDVDGADFIAWQTNYPTGSSATLGQGDSDYDGDVDGADFAAWQGSFPVGPAPGVSPIPEPASIILACFGISMIGWRERARSKAA
jgi:hypothetical protein